MTVPHACLRVRHIPSIFSYIVLVYSSWTSVLLLVLCGVD